MKPKHADTMIAVGFMSRLDKEDLINPDVGIIAVMERTVEFLGRKVSRECLNEIVRFYKRNCKERNDMRDFYGIAEGGVCRGN